MKKTNKILKTLATFIMVSCAAIFFNAKQVAAASKASVEFVNVATSVNTNGDFKGDSILITYKDKYFLVDTGYGYAYGNANDPLTKKIKSLVANGKYLSGIIITHSHKDHMGALTKIISSNAVKKGSVKDNGTTIYYNNTFINSGMKTAIEKANKKGVATQAINKGSIYNAYTGNPNSYNTVKNNNGLYVYGAALSLASTSAFDVNQSSMIVQLKTDNLKAIFLGDLFLNGLKGMEQQYGQKIMGIDYDVCKVGHHGLRAKNLDGNMAEEEIKVKEEAREEANNYYSRFKAEHYIFTTYKSKAESSEFITWHSVFKGELDKIGKTYYSSSSTLPIFK